MFCVVYIFTVKAGREKDFEESWQQLTAGLKAHRGSYGSRLYFSVTGDYVVHSEWPSREVYENEDPLPAPIEAVSQRMRACCEAIEIGDMLSLKSDLTRTGKKVGSLN